MRFTITRIFARAPSRKIQSMVTLLRTWEMSSAAMTFSLVVAPRLHGGLVGG
jgi:hypothetical protein